MIAAFDGEQPVGFACFGLCDDGVVALVDVIAVDTPGDSVSAQAAVEALLDEAASRARHMGAVAIRGWSVTEHPFDHLVCNAARRLGWLKVRRGFDMILMRLPPHQDRSDVWPIDRWYISRIFTEGPSG
jgi:hypothetical protein